MYIYRPNRGLLIESMSEAKEFATKEEMFRYIYDTYNADRKKPVFKFSDLMINEKNKYEDKRTGWHNTMYVCVRRYGKDNYMEKYGVPQCIGLCATSYEEMFDR